MRSAMPRFTTAEGLRSLLNRLDVAGPGAWRRDADVEELMAYTIRKYRPLAMKHHCEPEDSAVAAFEALRTCAVRNAHDPWAVVTRAVQVTLIAEERAEGLLCSPAQARRTEVSRHHDARRFSAYETDLLEFHPALRAHADEPDGASTQPVDQGENASTRAFEAIDLAIALFAALGWPLNTATCALDYIAARLIECGSRPTTHAMLRRDRSAHAVLDLDRRAWSTLLRVTLGNPNPDLRHTASGHGVLLRLLIGDPVIELLADDQLVLEISRSAPRLVRTETEVKPGKVA
jgi:hypothetical protein